MKVIDGKGAIMGRLASYSVKEALKGEQIAIVNCEQIIITGTKSNIREIYERKRSRIGSGQQGPKISRTPIMIVKRAIRGMIPNHRWGRGKVAFENIKCYVGVPKEFESAKKIVTGKEKKNKFVTVKEISK